MLKIEQNLTVTKTFYNKVCLNLQNIEETALFYGKIYTADKNFTRPPVATVATNFKSGNLFEDEFYHVMLSSTARKVSSKIVLRFGVF